MLRRRRWGRLLDSIFGRPVGDGRKREQSTRRLQLERLEERRLLAATLSFSTAGVLTFADTANGSNSLTLSVAADGTYTFNDTTNTITVDPSNGNPFTPMGMHTATGSGATVKSIVVNLGGGSNTLTLDAKGNTLAPLSATDGGPATDTATVASSLMDSGGLTLSGFGTDQFGTATSGPILVTTTGAQDYKDPVSLLADTTLTSTAAAVPGTPGVRLESTVTGGGNNLAVTAAAAGSEFDGAAGGLDSLTVTGPTGLKADVTTAGGQDYKDPLTLSGSVTLKDTAGGSVDLESTVTGGGFGLTTQTTGPTTFGGAVSGLSALHVTGKADLNGGAVTTSGGGQTYGGAVTLTAGAVLADSGGGAVSFTSAVDAAAAGVQSLTVQTDGTATFGGAVGGVAALSSLTAEGFSANANGTTDLEAASVAGAATVTTTGAQDYFNPVTLGADQVLATTGPGGISFHASVDALTIGGQALTTETDGAATFDGSVGGTFALKSLTVEGFTANSSGTADLNAAAAPTVTTTGSQDYFNPLTLGATQVLESTGAGGITFHSTVDAQAAGAQALTTKTDGAATFDGILGGKAALKALTVEGFAANANGTLALNATPDASVTTAGNQDYFNPITLTVDQVFASTGAGNITFHSTVDAQTAGMQSLTTETDGTTTFDDVVGGQAALKSLTAEGFTAAAFGAADLNATAAAGAPTVKTAGSQDYNSATLSADQVLVSTGAGAITFHATVDARAAGTEALTAETDGTATFDGVAGGKAALKSLTAEGFTGAAKGATDLSAVSVGGSATATTSGNQDNFNAVTLGADQVLVSTGAGSITFHSTADALTNGGQALTTETDGATTFDGVAGGNFALKSLTAEGFSTTSSGTTALNATPDASVTTTGNQDYFNPLTLGVDQVLVSTGSGTITFHTTVDAQTAGMQALTTETDGTTVFDGVVGGAAPLKTLTVEGFTGAAKGAADLNAATAPTVTTTGSQDYFDPVVLSATQVLASTGAGNITFHSTVDAQTAGTQALTTETDGTATFDGALGGHAALKSLTVEGFTANANGTADLNAAALTTVTTTGNQDYFNPLTLSADQVLVSTGAGTLTFHAKVDALTNGGQALATETDGTAAFDGVVGGTFALKSLAVGGFSASGAGSADLNAATTPTVTTTGSQDYFNPLTLSATQVLVSTGAGAITFHSTVDAQAAGTQALTTETDGTATFDGVVGGKAALKSLTVEGFTGPATGAADLNAASVAGAATVTTTGNQDYFNPVTLTADQVLASTGAGSITFHSTVDAQTNGGQALTTKTDGTATFDGAVGGIFALKSLTVGGFTTPSKGSADLNAATTPTITTTGNQDYFNPVTLSASQVLVSTGSGNITFHATVDAQAAGTQALTTETDGTATFDGVVGGNAALKSLTVEGFTVAANGTADLNAASVAGAATATTTTTQDYFNAVTLSSDQVLVSSGASGITFHSMVDAQTNGGQALTTETDGIATFDGAVGGAFALKSLTVGGFTTPSKGSADLNAATNPTVTTTGSQDYFNPVTLSATQVLVSTGSGAITFHATVDGRAAGTQALTTETDGTATFDGVVGGNFALKSLTVEGFTSASKGAADLNALSAGTPTVTTTGSQDYLNPVTLSSSQILASTGSGALTFHATVDAQTSGTQPLTTETDGTATFDGVVGGHTALKSLTVEGFTANANGTADLNAAALTTVTTTGNQDYFNPVTLSASQVLASTGSGAITFHATVDAQTAGMQALTTRTDGIATFDGVVGGNFALKSLTVGGFSANVNGSADLNAVAVPAGSITIKTTGSQSYFNAVVLSADQALASTAAGGIGFLTTVDAQTNGIQGLTTETDGMLAFGGAVGGNVALKALLVEGFSAPGKGFTTLGGFIVNTAGSATDSGGNQYTQEYANPVTVASLTNSLTREPGAGNGTIIFGSTVDSTSNQALDVSTALDTVKFEGPVGSKFGLSTLQITVGTGIVQPAVSSFNVFNLILAGSGTFNLGQADNLIGNLAAAVSGPVSLKDDVQLTIGTLHGVQTGTPFTGVTTNGNNFILTLDQGVQINQVVNTGATGLIAATLGLLPATPAIHVTVAANLVAQSATFDGTNSLNRVIFNIAPSIGTPITVIGKPHILPPNLGNELDLDLQAGLPGFQGAGSPAGTKLFATAPPPQFPLDGSGFYTFTNRARLNYKNIGQLGQFQASAYSFLNSAGTPVIVIQASQGSVDQNGNIVPISVPLLAPLPVLQPPNNPFIFSPAFNSPYPASPPRVQFAFVRGGTVPDLIIAGGAGELPVVTVIDGNAILAGSDPGLGNSIVSQFFAFDQNYLGGISLAAGNLTGGGPDDIVTGMANGGDVVRTFVDDRPDPRAAGRVFFDQISGPLGDFNAFGGFGGGVRIALAPTTSTQHAVLLVAPGPGLPGMVTAYDGATGAALAGLTPDSLFGPGFTGGVVLAATDNFLGTGNSREVLVGMNTGGSALDLFSFNNNAWGFQGQIGEVFTPPVPGRTSTGPVDPESTMGIGSLAFGGSAGFFFVGSGSTQPANMREYPYAQANPGVNNSNNEVPGFPVPFVQGELQVSGVLTPTLADPPPDAVPTVSTTAPSDPVVAPGGTDVINFTATSAMYPDELRVTATSSNQVVLPDTDLFLTQNGSGYTLTIKPPAGTNSGTAVVTVNVTDPQNLSTPLSFNVTVDQAPMVAALNPTNTFTLPHGQLLDLGPILVSSPTGNNLTYNATAYADNPLYDLENKYQFQGVGYGHNDAPAYVLTASADNGNGNPYYLLRPDGSLYAYDGSGSYAHTFANGTAIANVGANTYTDPTLLLDAQPPVDYPSLYDLMQQYQFKGLGYMTTDATAYVLQASSNNSFGNPYYLIRSDGAVFAYDGTTGYAHTFANGQAIANFGGSVYLDPSQLLNAAAPPDLYGQLYALNQQYDLKELGGTFYPGTLGNQAQWIYSPVLNQYGQHWYTLTLSSDGTQALLRAWEGYQDSGVGAVIATLDPSVYSNPAWLTNATTPPALLATPGFDSSGNLAIRLSDPNYLGTILVDVTASDGMLSTTQRLTVTTTDTAPTITVEQNSTPIPEGGTQTLGQSGFPQTDSVITSDAQGNAVTTTASVSSYDPLFSLQQRYQFRGLGYYTAGATAYVLQSPANNDNGNPYYLLRPDGSLYAYDGSGSYAHTFANGTAIADTGANTYSDPTLLLDARPAVDYAGLYNLMQQYHFQGLGYTSAGATAYVLRAAANNSFGNPYYLLKANGGLYAYDGSGSFAHTFANGTAITTVDPGVYVNPSLLLDAKAALALYPQLYQAEQQFDLQELGGSFYTGLYGNAAKWLYSPVPNASGQHWYTLVLSADGTQALLYAWDGGNNSIPAGAKPVAALDPAAYADPTLLLDAKAPLAATGVTASVSGGVLTLAGPASFAGTFQVTVSATDGALSSSRTFLVTSPNPPAAPTAIAAQTASRSGSPLQVTLSASDAENDPVTYTAQPAGYSPAYNLQRVYGFTGVGYLTVNGVTAYVLHSSVLGGSGGYYLLKSDGGVYAYDGSGSYAHTFANANNLVANLDPGVYATPTLLTQAQTPAVPAAVVSVSGNTLTVDASGVAAGTVFEVFVTASDGAETTRTGFLVTVTA